MEGIPLRTALITGGQGDLAGALAKRLASEFDQILTPGRDALDVTCSASITAYFQDLDHLDLLINNAGLRRDMPLAKMDAADWDAVLDTNLRGAFLCSQRAAPLMQIRGGTILHIGSYSALNGPAGQANYAAAKAGLIGLTKSLAREWGPQNIRVNCILPGWLETKFTRDVPPAARAAGLENHALGRFNTVEESARAICCIATLAHVSGQVFQLDSRVGSW